jgi:hypothetical protein
MQNYDWNDIEPGDPPDRVRWQDILWTVLGAFVAVLAAYAIVYWR